MKINVFQLSRGIKKHSSKQVVPTTYTLEKRVFAAATLKDCGSLLVRQSKKRGVYFGLFESSLHFQ